MACRISVVWAVNKQKSVLLCDQLIGQTVNDGSVNSSLWLCELNAILHSLSLLQYFCGDKTSAATPSRHTKVTLAALQLKRIQEK